MNIRWLFSALICSVGSVLAVLDGHFALALFMGVGAICGTCEARFSFVEGRL